MANGANLSKMKLFDVVACLESGLTEFGHALDQSEQAAIHQRFILLILDDGGGGDMSLFPHGVGVCMSTRNHLYWDPFSNS
jgi:hypothetical protein